MSKTPAYFRILVAGLAVASSIAMMPTAQAQSETADYGDSIHVVQPKPVLQKGRFSVTPRLGMTINDAVYRNFNAGASANFHVSERFFLGGLFQWYNFGGLIGGETEASRTVNAETGASVDAPFLNWAGGAEVGFVPLYGKFALLRRGILFYDVALTAGAVFAESESLDSAATNGGPGGTISLSTRLFINDWMALNLEVRDVIYMQNNLSHSVTLGVGMSFYLPTSFEYGESIDD